MSQSHSPTQRSTGRPDYIDIGTDTHGAFHVYATWKETIYVIEDGEITHKIDLIRQRRSVDDWVEHVKLTRGFDRQELFTNFADFAGNRIQ